MLTSIKVGFGSSATEINYYIKQGTFKHSIVERCVKEITTRDGTKYRSAKQKDQYTMTFLDMSDSQYAALKALFTTNPMTMTINGVAKSYFHSGWGATADKTIGTAQNGLTYFTGMSLTLEEQ